MADKTRIPTIEAADEAEGLEAGIRVRDHPPELLVVHLLHYCTGGDINHQARTAEMVGDDPVRHAALDHVRRDVARATATVDEARDEIAIDRLADPAVLTVEADRNESGSIMAATRQTQGGSHIVGGHLWLVYGRIRHERSARSKSAAGRTGLSFRHHIRPESCIREMRIEIGLNPGTDLSLIRRSRF